MTRIVLTTLQDWVGILGLRSGDAESTFGRSAAPSGPSPFRSWAKPAAAIAAALHDWKGLTVIAFVLALAVLA